MHYFFLAYSLFLEAVAFGGSPTARKSARAFGRSVRTCVVATAAIVFLAGCQTRIDDRIGRVYALARHPSEPKKDRIEALIHDGDRDIRATALVVMDSIDKVRAKKMAATALEDADGLVRAAAVTIVGEDADVQTIRELAARAADDPVWQVRARALDAISSSDDPAVAASFVRSLADPVRHVRRIALRVGIERPGLLPTDQLVTLVTGDPDWENRVQAAAALGVSKDPAAYAGLDAALSDSNEFVRAGAAGGLRSLLGDGIAR